MARQPKLASRAKVGADDQDRTGDLVLTKDVLCQLSYIGLASPGRGAQPSENLERETGIEPATNSLEGCDSTTELLPPSCRPLRLSAVRRAGPRTLFRAGRSKYISILCIPLRRTTRCKSPLGPAIFTLHAKVACLRSSRSERRMVAREGLEPSKAQGRQIYSLLRLTASLPRRCVGWISVLASDSN